MRRNHPEAAGNTTSDAASQREHELSFAMPVIGRFRFRPVDVDAHGDDRRRPVIHIEVKPGVAERLSHH
jgi:hypothetical protein